MQQFEDRLKYEYDLLQGSAGFAPLTGYAFLRMTGKDRVAFLHGLCTNDVKRLAAGQGCEMFLTTVQGKTLAFGWVFVDHDALEIELTTAESSKILQHLDKYLIREDVQLHDVTQDHAVWLLSGPAAIEKLASICPPENLSEAVSYARGSIDGVPVSIRRLVARPPLLHLVAAAEAATSIQQGLESLGFAGSSPQAAEVLRIECGLPRGPEEVSTDHLPQELDRNPTAISFTKGCYLGQETVARLDALGHVNRRLMGLRLPGRQPLEPGAQLSDGSTITARVTSSAYAPAQDRAIALAYVRRGYDRAGQMLPSDVGTAEVVQLPFESVR